MPQSRVQAPESFPRAVAGLSGTKRRPRVAHAGATTSQLGSEAREDWEGVGLRVKRILV